MGLQGMRPQILILESLPRRITQLQFRKQGGEEGSKQVLICRFFRLGISCKFNHNCSFRLKHDRKDHACRFFMRRGEWRFGYYCKFYHPDLQERRKIQRFGNSYRNSSDTRRRNMYPRTNNL